MSPQEPLRFGPFTLDALTLELWRDGSRVPLEPLPARLLVRLAENAGVLVSRRELLTLGWGTAPAVTNQSLNTCIHEIRHALAHDGATAVRLETLRGRGYRLHIEDAAVLMPDAAQRSRARIVMPGLAAAAAVAVAAIVALTNPRPAVPEAAQHYLERARYLSEETEDYVSARAVLDSGRTRFPRVAAMHAEWAEVSLFVGATEEARRGVADALRIDRMQVTALRVRGLLAMLESDWTRADSSLVAALQLDNTDTRTLMALAFRRAIERRFGETDRLVRQALAIDPLSTAVHRDAGILYLLAQRYADAERFCRETLRFKPRSAWATDCLFDVMVLTRRVHEAAYWGRQLLQLYAAAEPPASASADSAVAAIEAWRLVAWSRAVSRGANPFGLALAYAANGRVDDAVQALRAAAQQPSLGLLTIAVDPRLATLRQHAGFGQLLNQLKLAA